MNKIYTLCYVRYGVLYFTDIPLEKQWGDDWDDCPYEHNAGLPYVKYEGTENFLDHADKIVTILVKTKDNTSIVEPCDGYLNSPFSVKDINEGATPWLTISWPQDDGEKSVYIYGGMTYDEVLRRLLESPVIVYLPVNE